MLQRRFRAFLSLLTATRNWVICLPYLWLSLFFLLPFLIVFRVSLSQEVIGIPPYSDLVQWISDTALSLNLHFLSYSYLIEDTLYVSSYLTSVKFAFVTTVFSLLLGYPMAFGITKLSPRLQTIMLLLIMVPFWTSFLIRVYAWLSLLSPHGIINNSLMGLGLINEPLQLLFNEISITIGMVYCYLPFMILPIYVSLEKMDPHLKEAASDLGAGPIRAFFTIILPLSAPGMLTGCLLVFIPCVGEFVIPEILGGSDNLLIGRLVWNEFFLNRSWPTAAALAIALLVFLFIPIYGLQKLQKNFAKKLES